MTQIKRTKIRKKNFKKKIMTTKTQKKETMKGKLPRKKPRKKMLDLLMEQKDKKISYEELKRGAESGVG